MHVLLAGGWKVDVVKYLRSSEEGRDADFGRIPTGLAELAMAAAPSVIDPR